ncbi:hypothetical protein BHM03_00003094 [Ensete ventricosum]|nr:hypothetical protein BHM03_00003094 [Ensete ventricosum]
MTRAYKGRRLGLAKKYAFFVSLSTFGQHNEAKVIALTQLSVTHSSTTTITGPKWDPTCESAASN